LLRVPTTGHTATARDKRITEGFSTFSPLNLRWQQLVGR
jgi:hypothetical protein